MTLEPIQSVEYTLAREEFVQAMRDTLQNRSSSIYKTPGIRWLNILLQVLTVTLGILLGYLTTAQHSAAPLIVFIIWLVTARMLRDRVNTQVITTALSEDGSVLGKHVVRIEPEGLRDINAHGESLIRWSGIFHVACIGTNVLVYYDESVWQAIPVRAFQDETERNDFIAAIEVGIQSAGTQNRDIPLSATMPNAITPPIFEAQIALPSARNFIPHFLLNLRTVLKLTFLQRVGLDQIYGSAAQLAAMVTFSIIVRAAEAYAKNAPNGLFFPGNLPYSLFFFPWLMLAAWIATRRDSPPGTLPKFAIAIAGIQIFIDGFSNLAVKIIEVNDLQDGQIRNYALGAIWIWWLISELLMLGRLGRGSLQTKSRYAFIATCALIYPQWRFPIDNEYQGLWIAQQDPAQYPDYDAAGKEKAFYAQPDLLQDSLDNLKAGRAGIPEFFFVGFAGYGEQNVFSKEVVSVTDLMRKRFNTSGHNIELINNKETTLKYPFATGTSLSMALDRAGQQMNVDEDVLVLYMTSHGSHDHHFSVELWPMRFDDIEPQQLRAMLDHAGIKWRVLIISACYSGGFIPALKDEHTMIMTAADADHTSFGCGDDMDFTYFGKAYFDEALRHTYSFHDAFITASASIRKREIAEGQTPSNPQFYSTPAIESKLDAMILRLESEQHTP